MKKRDFEMIEEYANDPLDLFVAPSVEMRLDLYNNRSKYAKEFFQNMSWVR